MLHVSLIPSLCSTLIYLEFLGCLEPALLGTQARGDLGILNLEKRSSGQIPSPFPLLQEAPGNQGSSGLNGILGWSQLWESVMTKDGKWLLFFISSLFKTWIFANFRHQTIPFKPKPHLKDQFLFFKADLCDLQRF